MIHKNRPWFVIFLCSINKFLHLFLISVFDQKTFGLPRQSFKPKNHLHSAPAFSSPDPSYPFPSVSECFFSPENARPGWGCHASDVTRFTLVLPPSSSAANSMPPACCIYLVRVTPLSIPKKASPGWGLPRQRRDSVHFGVAAVQSGGKQHATGMLYLFGSSHAPFDSQKRPAPVGAGLFWSQ